MPEQFKIVKVKNPITGEELNAYDVPLKESNEKWSEFELEDGTKIRMKVTISGAHRFVGKYDPQGNPMYDLVAMPQIVTVYVPEELKKEQE
jgi:hypothetical protein